MRRIKYATESDLREIRAKMLIAYEIDEVGGDLFNNFNVVEDHFKEGKLVVYEEFGALLGYCAGLLRPGGGVFFIFEEYRGKGYGREFVNYIVDLACDEGSYVFCVMTTKGSVVFWDKMGFVLNPQDETAVRFASLSKVAPSSARHCSISISYLRDDNNVNQRYDVAGWHIADSLDCLVLAKTHLHRLNYTDQFIAVEVDGVLKIRLPMYLGFEIGFCRDYGWCHASQLNLDDLNLSYCVSQGGFSQTEGAMA